MQIREASLQGISLQRVEKRRGLNGSDVTSFAKQYAKSMMKKKKTNDSSSSSSISEVDFEEIVHIEDSFGEEGDTFVSETQPVTREDGELTSVSRSSQSRAKKRTRERLRKIDVFRSAEQSESKIIEIMEKDGKQLEKISHTCEKLAMAAERFVTSFDKLIERM